VNVAEAAQGADNDVLQAGSDDPQRHAVRLIIRLEAALARAAAIGKGSAAAHPDR
jgi:hypothetical protein